ncbi:MAG TPA: polynucleotide adenylyltransferase PcnB, partial [Thiothrix sp.]|nr:polynucleotide adenylyltransferase PcnB [Thiothrix sp.]
FLRKDCRGAFSFTEHKRFRGAYDFHCLRASAGEVAQEECEWWTKFQFATHNQQMKMCQQFSPPKRKRKPRQNKH